jgi:peptidoglycan/xylan/chitin deacetylase (PgdA/CDA1 family)
LAWDTDSEDIEGAYGLSADEIPNVGAVTDDTSVYRVGRLTQILRRRAAAVGAAILLCVVAIAVPVAVLVSKAGDAPVSGETSASAGVTGFSKPGKAGDSGQSGFAAQSWWASLFSADPPVSQVDATTNAILLGANELGQVPILMYHKIGNDVVPPARLRDDIARLKAAGFYPTTIRELADGSMDIPAGKSPVVLTFDDSSPTQYRILADGSIDPDCAVAIIREAAAAGDWAPKASFFPLLYLDTSANILFGQPEYAQKKLQDLVSWGFEIGSHTVDHLNLATSSPGHITKELAESQARLEELIGGGYQIYTLNPPYGEFPADLSLLASGESAGVSYEYKACLRAAGGYGCSPFSTKFDPMNMPRVTAYPTSTVPDLVWYFREYPGLRYVSDGNPQVISAPANVAEKLGALRSGLSKQVVRY